MKTKSAKAKGRRFQKWVAEQISRVTGIQFGKDEDIESRPMSQSGTDIILHGRAKELYPFSVECKNQERINLWSTVEQAKENRIPNTDFQIFVKRNRSEELMVMDAEAWFKLYKEYLDLKYNQE